MTKTLQYTAQRSESLKVTDEILIACVPRDPGAYAELYDRYLNPVYRYFYLRLESQPLGRRPRFCLVDFCC